MTSPSSDEIHGSKNWDGLIQPELNNSLREFILLGGDMCQATYDAYNSVSESPNCGNSNYGKLRFFEDVLFEDASRYKVVSFIYATAGINSIFERAMMVHPRTKISWDNESNWFGYVAVTSDEWSREIGRREVYVAWRGTIMSEEWVSNLRPMPVPVAPLLNPSKGDGSKRRFIIKRDPMVHNGWLEIYTSKNSHSRYVKTSAREQIHAALEAIKTRYLGEKLNVVVVGHSLGGSLATLCGFDLAENNVAGGDDVRVTVLGYGCPQVGNEEFKDRAMSLPNLKILRVNNILDTVPKLPDSVLSLYTPIDNAELRLSTLRSDYLRPTLSPSDYHNLQANLHVIAGWTGLLKPFDLKVKRNLALVNKSSNCLKSEYNIPAAWWSERNKGMEYKPDTKEWVFDPPPPAEEMIGVSCP